MCLSSINSALIALVVLFRTQSTGTQSVETNGLTNYNPADSQLDSADFIHQQEESNLDFLPLFEDQLQLNSADDLNSLNVYESELNSQSDESIDSNLKGKVFYSNDTENYSVDSKATMSTTAVRSPVNLDHSPTRRGSRFLSPVRTTAHSQSHSPLIQTTEIQKVINIIRMILCGDIWSVR